MHVLAEFPLDKIGMVISVLKTSANRILKRRNWNAYLDFSWQRGYALFSVSYSLVHKVQEYILQQRKHHGLMSCQEEFEKYLSVHDIEFCPECD